MESKETKNKMNDELFDVLLKHAATEYMRQEAEKLKKETAEAPEHTFTPEFELKMNQLINDERRKHSGIKWKKFKRAAAVFIAVAFTAALLSVTSVQAFRLRLYNFFFNEKENHVEIKFFEDAGVVLEKLPSGWDYAYVPGYLPEGYVLDGVESSGMSVTMTFKDVEGNELFFLQRNRVSGIVAADNEMSVFEEVTIRKDKGYLIYNEYGSCLSWHNNRFSFDISGVAELDELMKMAENIKIQK